MGVNKNIDLVFNRIQVLDFEEILKLSLERRGELSNFWKGLINQCFGIYFKSSNEIYFEYYNYDKKYKGYTLRLEFKELDFYDLLFKFIILLSNEFVNIESIRLYNSYITLYRTALENNHITTITNFEADELNSKNGELLIAGEYEIVRFINEVEFYRELLNFNKEQILQDKKQVYLMYSKPRNEFKIGRSKNPLIRKSQGKTFDQSIILLKTWKGSSNLETYLKKKFIKKNIGGEWFKLNFLDLKELNKLAKEYKN